MGPQRVGVRTQLRFAMAAVAAPQESAFDPPRWLEVLTAVFGAVLDAGSGSGSGSDAWKSEDEDVLDNEDDVLDEALAEVMEDDARDVAAHANSWSGAPFLAPRGRPAF